MLDYIYIIRIKLAIYPEASKNLPLDFRGLLGAPSLLGQRWLWQSR